MISMKEKIEKIKRVFTHWNKNKGIHSYSQCGEDTIINFLVKATKLQKWTWIDIGAHHPKYLSNTAMFYKNGIHGINIDADPQLMKKFYQKRKKDINLNIAISDKTETMDFYIMDIPTLNTLSKEEAHRYESVGHKIKKVIQIEGLTITDVVNKYCNGIFPNLLLLDAEGCDLQILKTILWSGSIPKIICVENVPYTPNIKNYFDTMQKNELTNYLQNKGYSIYAFTGINTIFVHNDFLKNA
ncbi:hypothetical protein FACS189434_00500 [Bacteroidia bacterium]|nr:hypothetical protein FACS189434_00500 [Bacteroidia bacterium]